MLNHLKKKAALYHRLYKANEKVVAYNSKITTILSARNFGSSLKHSQKLYRKPKLCEPNLKV